LKSLDISENRLNVEGTKLLAKALESNQIMTALNISSNSMTWNGEKLGDMSGVAALADANPGMGALLVLSLKSNSLRAGGGKALAESLKGNQVITELNIAGNDLGLDGRDGGADTSGVVALADVIPDMGAISTLTFGDKQAITMTTKMTEANFSGKLYSYEAQIVAAFLPKCT
jgi:hypothetical protein